MPLKFESNSCNLVISNRHSKKILEFLRKFNSWFVPDCEFSAPFRISTCFNELFLFKFWTDFSFYSTYIGMKYKLGNLQLIFRNTVLNSRNLVFYLWTEKSWEKVRCKQVRQDKNLFWRKEFARYRQFPLCTGSIPYKNHEKTSVLHKMSVDDRFPLWTESVVDRFYCI
jgi:hypothetical protein